MGPNRRDRGLQVLAGLVLVASLGYLLYRAIGGANSLIDRDFRGPINPGDTFEALPWLIAAAVASAAALVGWYLASRRAAETESAHGARRDAEQELERMRRAHDEQRRWNRELSAKLTELHRQEGVARGPAATSGPSSCASR